MLNKESRAMQNEAPSQTNKAYPTKAKEKEKHGNHLEYVVFIPAHACPFRCSNVDMFLQEKAVPAKDSQKPRVGSSERMKLSRTIHSTQATLHAAPQNNGIA